MFGLAACTEPTDTDDDDNDIIDDTPAYDDRGLVDDDCAHLDNLDGDWQPVWCDEFDEDGLPDSSRWQYDVGGNGWGNNELQYYTNADLDNAFVEDGVLNIKAIEEDFMGNEYTSARLVSKFQGDWLYGRIVVRAKMPSGRGTWPAIWMLPTDWQYGNWPASGEIDIMEHVGYDPGVVHGTIHTGAYNHGLGTQIGYSIDVPTAETAFHDYEMIWEPGRIELFVDGESYAIFGYNPDSNVNIENSDAWPFDQRFHLIMNIAVGGNWGGVRGIDPDSFPTELEVDYVRVYQKDYAGMDQEPPSEVTNVTVQDIDYNSVRFKYTHATDDVMIKEYNFYIDDERVETTTLNAVRIDDLDPNTTYDIDIRAVDFAGNETSRTLTITTEDVRTALGKIEAEDYDAMRGIQTETNEDDDTLNVGWIDDGDYLEYILNVEEEGTYRIQYRVAGESDSGRINLYTRSRFPHAETVIPATGDWQTWQTITSDTFTLTEGIHTFKLDFIEGGFNLNYFIIERVT